MLTYILTNSHLHASILAEITPLICEGLQDLATRLERCSTLEAAYNETNRFSSSATTVRSVISDTQIGDSVLKAGSKILIPYRQLHMDETVFGGKVKEFNHLRFLDNKDLHRDFSFKPFGGGSTYCPGRFLARREVLIFVALALYRFNMEPVLPNPARGFSAPVKRQGLVAPSGGLPRLEEGKFCLAVMPPVKGDDFILRIQERAH